MPMPQVNFNPYQDMPVADTNANLRMFIDRIKRMNQGTLGNIGQMNTNRMNRVLPRMTQSPVPQVNPSQMQGIANPQMLRSALQQRMMGSQAPQQMLPEGSPMPMVSRPAAPTTQPNTNRAQFMQQLQQRLAGGVGTQRV